MSIIATVYIPEGICLAAESRLTGTNTYTNGTLNMQDRIIISDNSQKLFSIKGGSIGVACCGDATIDNKSFGDFLRQFEIDEINADDNVTLIANKLKDYTMSKHGEGVVYHVAGYIDDVPYVYRIVNDIITRLNVNEQGNIIYGCAWNGETEAVTKLVLGDSHMQTNFDLMQLKDGVDLAEFLVDLTIKYQRFDIRLATCGGPIDSLVITKDYAKFIKHKILNP